MDLGVLHKTTSPVAVEVFLLHSFLPGCIVCAFFFLFLPFQVYLAVPILSALISLCTHCPIGKLCGM